MKLSSAETPPTAHRSCKLLLGAAVLLFAPACTFINSSGPPAFIRNKVELGKGNFRLVKSNVQGEATCPFVLYLSFDIGLILTGRSWGAGAMGFTTHDPNLREQAMADLHESYEMKGSQILVNVIEEFDSNGFLFFYREVKLTITADIVEFVDES